MSYYQTLEEITAPDAGKHQKFKNIQLKKCTYFLKRCFNSSYLNLEEHFNTSTKTTQ